MPHESSLNQLKKDKITTDKNDNPQVPLVPLPVASVMPTSAQNHLQPPQPMDLLLYPIQVSSNPIPPGHFYNQPYISQNIHYFTNQGIFIPTSTRPNHNYSFIPGNINPNHIQNFIINSNLTRKYSSSSEVSTRSKSENLSCKQSTNSQQMVFIPDLSETSDTNFDGANQKQMDEKFETLIMPVKIKKEENGQLELMPEDDNEIFLTSNDQWNIMHKIGIIKNKEPSQSEVTTKSINEEKNEKEELIIAEINDTNNREILTNIKNNTKGFVMLQLSKKLTVDENHPDLPLEIISKDQIQCCDTQDQNCVKIKLTDRDSDNLISQNIISLPGTAPSRFRKLRQKNVTRMWESEYMTTIDTRVKELPMEIVEICKNSCISVPDILFHQHSSIEELDSPSCEHTKRKPRANTTNVHWKLMCSLNNSESHNLHDLSSTSAIS